MVHRPFHPPQRTLMGPGPSDVEPRVLAALARPTIGHLDPAFIGLMDDLKVLLQKTFCTANPLTMPISGPGTAGMETCFANLVEPGDTVVVGRNGVFGGRMQQMIERCGGTAVMVDHEWGQPVDPDRIDAALAGVSAKAVAFVHAETSTGAASDAAAIATVARKHGALTIVDAVTSLGGSELRVDDWGLDAVYSGSQKCLSCTPGLSPVTFSPRAVAAIEARKTPVQSWFMDLTLVMGYWGSGTRRSYHHTAPINALYALHESLVIVHEEGLEQAWTRHRRNHEALRAGLEALSIQYIVAPEHRLPQLNAVTVPTGVDDALARRTLLTEHDLEIGGGLGALAGKAWRIGLMGHASRPTNVFKCLTALEAVLQGQGVAVTGGKAAAAARAVYAG